MTVRSTNLDIINLIEENSPPGRNIIFIAWLIWETIQDFSLNKKSFLFRLLTIKFER